MKQVSLKVFNQKEKNSLMLSVNQFTNKKENKIK